MSLPVKPVSSLFSFLSTVTIYLFCCYIVIHAAHPYLTAACYVLAAYFSYIITEKYEVQFARLYIIPNESGFGCIQEVIFDKERGRVSMMNSRFFEKHVLGYRRISKL